MNQLFHTGNSCPLRVLIVKLSSLGDLFHALPLVHLLRRQGSATVDWVAQKEYCSVVTCFTEVSRVIPFPRRGFWRAWPAFCRCLRHERYDMVLDCQGLLKSALVARLARGKRRIGPSFHREGARWLYDAVAGPRDKDRHAVEENLDMARFLGVPIDEVVFPLRFPPLEIAPARPRIGVVPVSRWQHKNWPAERFAAMVRGLTERTGGSVCVYGGAGAEEGAVCASIANSAGVRAYNMGGKTSLTELGSHLAAMDVVVTNDSGPMHMAAALGVPVVALFGPTDPRRTGPYGARHRIVAAPCACSPCLSRSCRDADAQCMRLIGVDDVRAALLEILGK